MHQTRKAVRRFDSQLLTLSSSFTSHETVSAICGDIHQTMAPTHPSPPREHAKCFAKPAQPPRQARLVLTEQSLCLKLPPVIPPPRSPAPNAVRRIIHTPFFSTTDPSLISFVRFPYDIRRQIYTYLLCSSSSIQYNMCVPMQRLIMTVHHRRNHPYERHGLFPSILECCRLTNEEGTPILYGHNEFKIMCCGDLGAHWQACNSWPLAENSMKQMTRLNMGYYSKNRLPRLDFSSPRYYCNFFPALRVARITMTLGASEWEEFLTDYVDCLKSIPTMEFRLDMLRDDLHIMWRKHGRRDEDGKAVIKDFQGLCLRPYQQVCDKLTNMVRKKETWHWYNRSDDYGPYVEMRVLWEDSTVEFPPRLVFGHDYTMNGGCLDSGSDI